MSIIFTNCGPTSMIIPVNDAYDTDLKDLFTKWPGVCPIYTATETIVAEVRIVRFAINTFKENAYVYPPLIAV